MSQIGSGMSGAGSRNYFVCWRSRGFRAPKPIPLAPAVAPAARPCRSCAAQTLQPAGSGTGCRAARPESTPRLNWRKRAGGKRSACARWRAGPASPRARRSGILKAATRRCRAFRDYLERTVFRSWRRGSALPRQCRADRPDRAPAGRRLGAGRRRLPALGGGKGRGRSGDRPVHRGDRQAVTVRGSSGRRSGIHPGQP